jgi:hypothetical protein
MSARQLPNVADNFWRPRIAVPRCSQRHGVYLSYGCKARIATADARATDLPQSFPSYRGPA